MHLEKKCGIPRHIRMKKAGIPTPSIGGVHGNYLFKAGIPRHIYTKNGIPQYICPKKLEFRYSL